MTGNSLVLSVRVKLFPLEGRLVRVAKRNTDEPLVEASIVVKMLSEEKSYSEFSISRTTVNRSWFCGNRSKGGRIAMQAFLPK